MAAVVGAASGAQMHRGVVEMHRRREVDRQTQGTALRRAGADDLREGMLPGIARFGTPAWAAGYEAIDVLDDLLKADSSEPGSNAARDARCIRLRQLLAAGTQEAPGLRAVLLRHIAEHMQAQRPRNLRPDEHRSTVHAATIIMANEGAGIPPPSAHSVSAAAQQFDALVSIIECFGCMLDELAAPLAWSMRAATSLIRSREHLRIEPLLRIIETDLTQGRQYHPACCTSLVSVLSAAQRSGMLGALQSPGAAALATKCLAGLTLRADQDLEDVALDSIAVALCVRQQSQRPNSAGMDAQSYADAWLAAHRERDAAAFHGKLPHPITPRTPGGAARCRNDRGSRPSSVGVQSSAGSSWRKVLDVDPYEAHMRERFAHAGAGFLGQSRFQVPPKRCVPSRFAAVQRGSAELDSQLG